MMSTRNFLIQKSILFYVHKELEKRNIPNEECLKFLSSNTTLKESRLKAILQCENIRPITLDELMSIAEAFDLNAAYFLENINLSNIKKT